ncbi:MAG: hypothetical protein B1H03_02410 [Planctomycetales bacterium 4484_113]|nr:MAG: hypothetical protein B1H03_02410 [Planctomycetales bacterium 4484_113]
MPPILITVFLFVLGLVFGSFFNVLIYRLPRELSIVKPGSFCPSCRHPIAWYDNIPLLSWLILRGRCRHCGAAISLRYPLVELMTGIIFAGVPPLVKAVGLANVPAAGVSPLHIAFAIIFISILALVLIIDLEHQIIPDELSVALFVLGWMAVFALRPPISPGWVSSLIGMFVLSLFFLAFALLLGGFGLGDVKLAVGLGAFFGWQLLVVAAFLSFAVGGVFAISFALYLMSQRKLKARIAIPFGPYLAIGAALTLFIGDRLLVWYLSFFRPV